MDTIQDIFNKKKLRVFTDELRSESFIQYLRSRISYDFETIRKDYFDYIEQAEFGVRYLSKLDIAGKRILEIGSGVGILTAWLLMNKVDVVGIEPSALGFHFHNDLYTAIWNYYQLPADRIHDLSAEQLDPVMLGHFHLVFSINVIEHIPAAHLPLVFGKMKDVLHADGIMYHHCPNYTIPYEPHYGLPLVPYFPQLTGRLFGVAHEGLWQSVNFITLPQVKQLTKNTGMEVRFQKELMKEAFTRLEYDKEFAQRHKVLAKLYTALRFFGIIRMMALIPPALCTPMTFAVMYPDNPVKLDNFSRH